MAILIESVASIPQTALNGVVTIGNFDGVHRGHRKLIEQVTRLATKIGGPSIVFTFDPPPARILRPDTAPAALTWMKRRSAIMANLGVDYLFAYPTSLELLALSPREFFERIVVGSLGAKALAEGPNFRFGRNRTGDIQELRSLCREHNIEFELLESQSDRDELISSTRIREYLESGDIVAANRLLVEPYRLIGTVEHGRERGRTIGFPTANLEQVPVLVPPHGVYAGRVTDIQAPRLFRVSDPSSDLECAIGQPVAVNIGPNPTFDEHQNKVEVHILNFNGDLYGSRLEIELLQRLRGVTRFNSKDELLAQLRIDCDDASRLASIQ